uniref:Secreted protein n=1 Tax=Cacopsylla melanoneura TaxID=428564 RepID=A0A8D8VFS0_9HEMI
MQVKVLSYIFLITLILALVNNSVASCINCFNKPQTTDEAEDRAGTSSGGKTKHQQNMETVGKGLGNFFLGTGEPLSTSDTMIGALVRTDERQDRKEEEQEKQARAAAAAADTYQLPRQWSQPGTRSSVHTVTQPRSR